jgi:type IV secretion system protein VirB9
VRFLYPPDPAAPHGPTPAQQVEGALERAQNAHPQNVDYWYCGDASIKPIAASDDGVQTRLTFGARSELPAIFVLNDDGSESLLNFSIDAGDVIIQRVAPRFVLRRGKLTGCIVNRGYVGSGERLKSGTISPDVTRERRDEEP